MKQVCVLILITNVTKITCTESHEAALCTDLENQRLQQTVHRIAGSSFVY
jgi:hypothetical protein